MKIEHQQSIKQYTTLKIGGIAEKVFFPENKEEVITIINKENPLILGNGSNVLIDDQKTFESVMIMKKYNSIRVEDTTIICDAGISLKEVCIFAYEHELTGLEFAYGIPGSVGGAIVMNAGAYGGEMKDVVQSVRAFNQKELLLDKKQLNFSYRHSIFSDTNICVLEVAFQLQKGKSSEIKIKMDNNMQLRLSKQPLDQPSAGSTFKRGSDFYASALINQCELKGLTVGGASVSTKHAGFLINHNRATFHDFLNLIHEVQKIVEEKTGKKLEPEVKIIR